MHMYIKIGGTGEQLPETATVWDAALDTSTNLMWEANLSDKKYKWNDINQREDDVNAAGLCGHSDWRAPTIEELRSLVKEGVGSPTIDARYFPKVTGSSFWTSSTHAYFADVAWMIDFYDGREDYYSKSVALFVLLVRNNLLTAS